MYVLAVLCTVVIHLASSVPIATPPRDVNATEDAFEEAFFTEAIEEVNATVPVVSVAFFFSNRIHLKWFTS